MCVLFSVAEEIPEAWERSTEPSRDEKRCVRCTVNHFIEPTSKYTAAHPVQFPSPTAKALTRETPPAYSYIYIKVVKWSKRN